MSFLNKISRRKFIYGTSCSICGSLILPSCTEIPLTERKQFNLHSYNMPIVILDNLELYNSSIFFLVNKLPLVVISEHIPLLLA